METLYSTRKELGIDDRKWLYQQVMMQPSLRLAGVMDLDILLHMEQERQNVLISSSLMWSLGGISLYLPIVSPRLIGNFHDLCVCLFLSILSNAVYFQNHLKMHSFLLWVFAL